MTDAKVNLCPWSKKCLRQVFSFTIIHIVINPKTKQKLNWTRTLKITYLVKSEESKPFKPFSEFSITKGHNHVQTGLKQSEVSFIMNIIGAFRD